MTNYKLAPEIIRHSNAQTWDEAVKEWELKEVYESDAQSCLCGHFPIIEICVIRNAVNGEEVIVGNCCVKKFIGLPSDRIFQAIKRVRKDKSKSLNAEAIEHAFERKWINAWEKNFYMDNMKKRKLTEKQLKIKKQINEKLAQNLRKN
jgi:hypothetical protein